MSQSIIQKYPAALIGVKQGSCESFQCCSLSWCSATIYLISLHVWLTSTVYLYFGGIMRRSWMGKEGDWKGEWKREENKNFERKEKEGETWINV